ncbi:hypothetical protein BDF21DRAFT_428183 [Thamnidium elegans]|nr:hypothetical protein BDF21DRAFT_428183 [Thamnidium elegans]
MEAKVHDATNNEAWGASSTVMQEIAQATFNYQYFNEIMPTIYKRFTEKEAKYWRQIYKSLVLLEYLVKNGSERVVDDARSHVSMIKMMKNFHYVDEKGKDQGINVRSRAKELAELLGDVDTIKAERKKAKKNRNKYTGVGSEGGMSFSGGGGGGMGGGGGRYEGFGSESNYSSGGGSSSMNQSSFGNSGNDFFDDERPGRYDDFDSPSNQRRGSSKSSRTISPPAARKVSDAKPKQKTAKELNLFDFDEPVASTSKGKSNDDDWGDFAGGDANDDFDDFQSAPITTTKAAAVKTTTTSAKKSNDIFDLLGDDSTFSSPAPTKQPNNLMLSQGMNFDTLTTGTVSQPVIQPSSSGLNTPSGLNTSSGRSTPSVTNIPTTNDTPIGGMWSQASNFVMLDSLGKTSAPIKPTQGPSMNSLKNNSVNAGWNNWASANTSTQQQQQQQQQEKPKQSSAFDDLLF